MFFSNNSQFRERGNPFNMTPVIDIVFLLIVFFMVVCRFIEAENFPVRVPDGCEYARKDAEQKPRVITVTVLKSSNRQCRFAVGAEQISPLSYDSIVGVITWLLDERLKDLPDDERVVTLRIDKEVTFADAQYALAGIAESIATDIRLAALKEHQANLE
ncbi:ExbD/TolR family protein [Planctomycetota bacterium]